MADMEDEDMSGEAGEYDPQDHQARDDADTLKSAHEIRQDKPRHQKAMAHRAHSAQTSRMASANEKRAFAKRTGARMKKAFGPSAQGTSPFQSELNSEGSEK